MKVAAAGARKSRSDVKCRFNGLGTDAVDEEPENDRDGAKEGRASTAVVCVVATESILTVRSLNVCHIDARKKGVDAYLK